jgi:transcriptional regulator with XRE-family HTH domain
MSKSYDGLREDFLVNEDAPAYRHAYAEESLDLSVGTQIKVLREQRGWRQEDLAREAKMQQPMVSRYESVNYSNWSINTLKKLARAFDVWLDVRFRSFGELVTETNKFSRPALEVPPFKEDSFFKSTQRKIIRLRTKATAKIQIQAEARPFVVPPPTGAIQLPLRLFTASGAGPRLVEQLHQQPQPKEEVSVLGLSAKAGLGEEKRNWSHAIR